MFEPVQLRKESALKPKFVEIAIVPARFLNCSVELCARVMKASKSQL